MLRPGDAFAAFAGSFNRNVPRHPKNPRRRRGRVIGGRETNSRIGTFARGDFRRLCRRPLRLRLGQGRLIKKRDEGERVQVPRPARPRAVDVVCFEENLQVRIGERAGVKRGGGFLRRNRLRVIRGAACGSQQEHQKHPTLNIQHRTPNDIRPWRTFRFQCSAFGVRCSMFHLFNPAAAGGR